MLELQQKGFVLVRGFSSAEEIEVLRRAVNEHAKYSSEPGVRGIAKKSREICEFVNSTAVSRVIARVLGPNAKLIRSIVFNKTPTANWHVNWHQDLSIAVENKSDMEGYRGWSIKGDACHVQPPVEILEEIITLRIHLDDARAENGALVVSPGTHTLGRIQAREVASIARLCGEHICTVSAGDVLLFRPLLMHCSRKATSPDLRRVLHLEFSAATLPPPMEWATAT